MHYFWIIFIISLFFSSGYALSNEKVVDITTRPGIKQRMLILFPSSSPKAVVILYAGGHGGLQITPDGLIGEENNNFVVRSRKLFAKQGFVTVTVDAPTDKQFSPYLQGFRDTIEHVADAKAIIAWTRESYHLPIWLIGTGRGTQSVTYIATMLLNENAPNGIVLTSTILQDKDTQAVSEMELSKITLPVLVVHHSEDGCIVCPYNKIENLMNKLTHAKYKQLLAMTGGGENNENPCEDFSHHEYNGIETQVVEAIAKWIKTH